MKFEYTGRHVEVSPAIRRHVEDHFKKLDHIFNGDTTLNTHVIIDVENTVRLEKSSLPGVSIR
jgi:ribosome-associated translation inhibitor RaiA